VSNHGERDASIDSLLREAGRNPAPLEPTDACVDAEQAAAWFDDGLPPVERSRIEAHLADCARCQALLGAMARTDPDQPGRAPASGSIGWLGWLLPVAAAAAIIVAVRVIPDESTTRPAPEADAVAAEAPPPPRGLNDRAAGAARESRAVSAEAAKTQALASGAPPLVIASPDAAVQWRVQPEAVERSTDGGATWSTVSIEPPASVAAGAAPASMVCWLVGRGGLVLRTADGITWQRLSFPETVDLTAVEARDAERAVVTAADGRRFQTDDGGRTWTNRLQEN